MASWAQVEEAAPELAKEVQRRFDAHRHKVMATLRADGSPRVSGTEATFGAGEVWIGSMPGAMKAKDLQRDPRLALHSGSDDPPDAGGSWDGDAKLSGRAVELTGDERVAAFRDIGQEEHAAGDAHLFRIDIRDVSVVRLGEPADHLIVEVWTEHDAAPRRIRRD